MEREVPLSDVIDLATLAKSSLHADISALQAHVFDFVLFSPQGIPVLVVEFDGPVHNSESKRHADIRKNRACWFSVLPIRRFRIEHVQPHDKTALVDWVFHRYSQWTETTAREDASFPADDPRFWFDLQHPFPGSRQKATYLWKEYRIQSDLLDTSTWAHAICAQRGRSSLHLEYNGEFSGPDGDFTRWLTVRRQLRLVDPSKDRPSSIVLASFEKTISYEWSLPVFDSPGSISPMPIHFAAGIPEVVVLYQDLDGTSACELAHCFANYLLMVDVVKWAHKNLPKSRHLTPRCTRRVPRLLSGLAGER